MAEILPDAEFVYVSNIDDEYLVAIGRLITCWAAVEVGLPGQVARIIATGSDESNAVTFDSLAYIRAAAVCQGTGTQAALNQLQNLLPNRAAEMKPHADKILKIKPKRDAIAHRIAAMSSGVLKLQGFAASRQKMGTDSFFTLEMLNRWPDELLRAARAIDTVISDEIRFNWEQVRAATSQWFASPRPLGVTLPDIQPQDQDIGLPATPTA